MRRGRGSQRGGFSRAEEPPPPGLAARRAATALLRQVVEHRVSLDALVDESHGNPHMLALDPRDRALVRAILGVALRRRGEITAAIDAALDSELPETSGALLAILHIAVAQILFLDVPDHAAVNIAVAQAGADRRTGRARGLVNGLLRHIARERDKHAGAEAPARANTPDWLWRRWSATYGEADAARIADAHRAQPPLDLALKGGAGQDDASAWAERLGGTLLPTGSLRLAGTPRVTELPGFAEGAWWVQDAAAALPGRLLGEVRGLRVADLCAAPGGKTAALAAAGAEVTALDLSGARLKRLSENLARLNLSAHLAVGDLLDWQPAEPFDAVLLDAPCSATGTIRRHPDIPWIKRPPDVAVLAAVQARMLSHAASLVAPGGVLVYCTCSLEPEEGAAQVAPFLARHADFALVPVLPEEVGGLAEAVTAEGCLRTLPFHAFDGAFDGTSDGASDGAAPAGMDGFFAARFRRAGRAAGD